ncbi:MAG: hypothetical protein R3336_09910, partial [Phycisphaeraceae bacterium]|nr:hypothetical protein [Phycisphaeraceae bacterium]
MNDLLNISRRPKHLLPVGLMPGSKNIKPIWREVLRLAVKHDWQTINLSKYGLYQADRREIQGAIGGILPTNRMARHLLDK